MGATLAGSASRMLSSVGIKGNRFWLNGAAWPAKGAVGALQGSRLEVRDNDVKIFGGCGSAVFAAAFPSVGIGLLGVSLAFGLTDA